MQNYSSITDSVRNWLANSGKYRAESFTYPLSIPTYDELEISQAIDSMINYRTTMWQKVEEFEQKFGDKFGGEAIMVNSGSSADLIISFALSEKSGGNLKKGSKILIPAVTWPTQIWSVIMAGFRVELIDVDRETLNLDLDDFAKKLTSDVSAVFLVHLLGNTCDIEKLQKICFDKKVLILEDCCESLGTKYNSNFVGTFGLASSFSFFFAHHMVTMEGGMILTQDAEFAHRCKLLRAHGWSRTSQKTIKDMDFRNRYNFVNWGFNVRPTELQAGFGLEQLKKIDGFNKIRRNNAELLKSVINKYKPFLSSMKISANVECNWFSFPILISENSKFSVLDLSRFLEQNGIETRPIVAGNMARQLAVKEFDEIEFGDLQGANFVHDYGLYIGIHPKEMSDLVNLLDKVLAEFFMRRDQFE